MSNYLRVDEVVESISKTHSFNKDKLKFLNTSDIYAGKIVNINELPVTELKGQAKKAIKQHDILLSEIRPKNRRFAYVDFEDTEDFVVSTKLMVLRKFNPDVNNKYLYYFLTNDQMLSALQARAENRICSFPQITFDLLSDYKIRVPALSAQEKIAAALSALDAKIDCNNRINAELEAMARTLYEYWFVQFDFPFDFAQGRPEANGKPYQSSGGKMVYNATLKREIPVGWRVSTIGETFKTHLGGTPSRGKEEYWNPGEVNWLSSGENPSMFVVAPDERISNLGLRNSPAKLLPQGTVILSIVRHLRASILGIEAATNQSVVGILETDKLKHWFIYPYLVREIPRLMALRTGAQQPHINKGVLDESLLVLPDEATLEAYTNLAAPLFLQIKNHHQQNRELAQLRDWLLPMLMNGQVTVA